MQRRRYARWTRDATRVASERLVRRASAPSRVRTRLLWGTLALSLAGCGKVLGLDDYDFESPEEIPEQTPALPLEPNNTRPSTNVPSMPPNPNEGGPVPTLPDGGFVAPARDAGGGDVEVPGVADASTPPPPPPPDVPAPRPILVSEPLPLPQLIGSPTGGQPRTTNCPGGVMRGLFFQNYADRLSYVWPICGFLQPGEPSLTDGASFDAIWLDALPEDPVFAPLREGESFGRIACPANQYVVGLSGSYDDPVAPSVAFRSVSIQCAGLNADPNQSLVIGGDASSVTTSGVEPADGAIAFSQPCPAGSAATQLELRFGAWLDALGMRCSSIRLPFAAGHACAGGEECQSGSCDAAGVCAP